MVATPPAAPETPRPPRLLAVVIAVIAGLVALATAVGVAVGSIARRPPAVTPSAATQGSGPVGGLIPAGDITAVASSTHPDDGSLTYGVANTLDGRLETAWNSDGERVGTGVGVTLTYRFRYPVDLRRVRIWNGYQKTTVASGRTTRSFDANERLHTVTLRASSGTTWKVNFEDVATPQVVDIVALRTSTVTITVVSFYPGAQFPDLALSETQFEGSRAQ